MTWVRTCIRCRINGFGLLWRMFGHARRPYFLFGLGVVLLFVSSVLLHHTAGDSAVIRILGRITNSEGAANNLSQSGRVSKLSDSHLVMASANGSRLQTALVDQMEHRLREMKKKINVGRFRISLRRPPNASDAFRFRYRDLAASQSQRLERIRHVCQAKQLQEQRGKLLAGETPYHEGWYGRKFLYAVMEVYESQNFFFCPVLKVGSTFFRRLFYALNYQLPIRSPYDVPIDTALGKRARHLIDLINPAPVSKARTGQQRAPNIFQPAPRPISKGTQLRAGPARAANESGKPATVTSGARIRVGQQRANSLPKPAPKVNVSRSAAGPWAGRRVVTGRHLNSVEDLDLRALAEQRVPHTAQEDKRIRDFLHNAGKVMFTRDPYTKLLSGYMDKLFAPNPYFWGNVGRYIINKFRPNPSPLSSRCGHDVTFPEFIQYVIDNEQHNSKTRDTHFVPSYDQCKPCDFDYDVIGKMETFPADVSLVLAQLGHNLSQSTLDTWSEQSEADAIADSIISPYNHWKRTIVKCMTWTEANQRIWRKLQTRGLVNKQEPLPEEDYQKHPLNGFQFIGKVQQHWQRFRTSGLQSRQKREALSSAFSVIAQRDLELVREYFSLDFDLFQYDPRPDVVFKAKRTWNVFKLS